MPRPEHVTVLIETARSHLDEEVTQLQAEQQMLEHCAERMAVLTVQPSQSATCPAMTPIAETPAAATTHDIRMVYQETVMALSQLVI
jgi:hypothetical protein